MCIRYALRHSPEDITEILGLGEAPVVGSQFWYEADCCVPVLRQHPSDKHILETFTWGILNPWAGSAQKHLIHIRSENLQGHKLLKQFLDRQTCVMPFSGFYASRGDKNKRQAYYICREDRKPFLAAGIICGWMSFRGSEVYGCAMLTTAADKVLIPEGNRMPFVLNNEDMTNWLEHDLQYQMDYPCPVSSISNDALCTYRLPYRSPVIEFQDGRVHPRPVKERKVATKEEETGLQPVT